MAIALFDVAGERWPGQAEPALDFVPATGRVFPNPDAQGSRFRHARDRIAGIEPASTSAAA